MTYCNCRIPNDINSLRILECISVTTDNRSKHLRSQIALQFLIQHFGEKVSLQMTSNSQYVFILNQLLSMQVKSHREVLEFLLSVNMKDKDCDFLKIYIYLVLVENSLLCHPPGEDLVLTDLWCKYLQKCSTQITSTDWRSYASKVYASVGLKELINEKLLFVCVNIMKISYYYVLGSK